MLAAYFIIVLSILVAASWFKGCEFFQVHIMADSLAPKALSKKFPLAKRL